MFFLEEVVVPTLPTQIQPEAVGIVIRSGAPLPKPVRFWAYVWAADDKDAVEQHWHHKVPTEHAA